MLFVQLFVIFVHSVTAKSDLEIHTISPVYAITPVDLVILPCNYTVSDPNTPVSIHWERDQMADRSVLWRYSNGVVDPGPAYKYIADLGEGCSLILKNPSDDLADNYTVTVDIISWVTSKVQLFIIESTERPDTEMNTRPSSGDVTTPVTKTSVQITALAVVVGVGFVFIFVLLVFVLRTLRRAKWLQIPEGDVDICGRHVEQMDVRYWRAMVKDV